MKPPTKKELERLAVEALGDRARLRIIREPREVLQWSVGARAPRLSVSAYRHSEREGRIALAAALRALAEVTPCD